MQAPLEGIKVLDFSRYISGPNCGMILGDLGADVIKIEKIRGGDEARILPPMEKGESFYHFAINRNKRSVCMDFRSPKAQEMLFDMARKADVILHNFRPGTMEKMGLGYEKLRQANPGIIMAQISGFGQEGPYRDKPGFDAIAQAMSGVMSLTGDPDGKPFLTGCFFIDFSTSLYTVIGILAALYARKTTGKGQVVDATLLDSALSVLLSAIPDQILHGNTMTRVGNRDRYSAPANLFQSKDGDWIILIAGQDAHFERFVKATHMEHLLEDPRFCGHLIRLEHAAEIEEIVKEWVSQRSTQEILSLMDEAGVTCAKVEDIKEVVENPQVKFRKKIIMEKHKKMGKVPIVTPAFDLSEMPFVLRYMPPVLGEHTDEVLKEWLQIEEQQLEELKKQGTIK